MRYCVWGRRCWKSPRHLLIQLFLWENALSLISNPGASGGMAVGCDGFFWLPVELGLVRHLRRALRTFLEVSS